jgi:hypothetical protein
VTYLIAVAASARRVRLERPVQRHREAAFLDYLGILAVQPPFLVLLHPSDLLLEAGRSHVSKQCL